MTLLSKFGTKPEGEHCENISQHDLDQFKETSNEPTKRTTYIQ